jgi:hypothetical protein
MIYFLLYRCTENIRYIYRWVSVFREGRLFIFKNGDFIFYRFTVHLDIVKVFRSPTDSLFINLRKL